MSGPDDYKPPSFMGIAVVAIGSLLVIALLILLLSNALQACGPGECPGTDPSTPASAAP
jgi:hypothetical protein